MGNVPAHSVFLHFPVLALGAVEDVPGVLNVPPESPWDLPLRVVTLGRRDGDVTAGINLLRVLEDGLAPPLELAIWRWRETADEWTRLCGVALHSHRHRCEFAFQGLVELHHARGDASRRDPVTRAEVDLATCMGTLLQQLGRECACGEDDMRSLDGFAIRGVNAGAAALLVEFQRGYLRRHILDAQLDRFAGDGS